MSSDAVPERWVKTRRVHYISGYDPRGVRHYRRLYRQEATKQAPHLGGVMEIGPLRKAGPKIAAWTIDGDWDGRRVSTDYQFMIWDDVVRAHWNSNPWPLIRDAGWFHCIYSGRYSRGAGWTAAMPLIYFAGLALLIFLTGALAWAPAHALGAGNVLAAAIALIPMIIVGVIGARLAGRFAITWIFRSCIFLSQWSREAPSDVADRMDAMADWIAAEQARDPVDEVLIVGHSIGANVAVAVTARLLGRFAGKHLPPVFHLLTLGQCIPGVISNPANRDLRRDLAILNQDDRIPWTDASARADPVGFFRVNPIAIAGLEPRFADRPLQVTVPIFRMFGKEAYAGMRRNKLRLHFQYLMASEFKADYDYFRITAGPDRLSDLHGSK